MIIVIKAALPNIKGNLGKYRTLLLSVSNKQKKKMMLIMSFSGDNNCYQGCFT